MTSIKIVILFCLLVMIEAQKFEIPQKISLHDLTMFMNCLQNEQETGNTALQIGVLNPYVQPYDFIYKLKFGENISMDFDIFNVVYYNYVNYILNLVEVPTSSPNISIFNYTFIWEALTIDAKWRARINVAGVYKNITEGSVYLPMGDRRWIGVATITAGQSVKLEMISTITNSSVTLGNLGVGLKDKVERAAKIVWETLLNSNLYNKYISAWWSIRYTEDWLKNPERVGKLWKLCKSKTPA